MGAVASGVAGEAGSPPAIEIDGVSKRFGDSIALEECSLVVEAGSFVSILGPSGCGKTTLLRIIGGFESQDTGTVRIHGHVVDREPPNRRPVNMVFQRYALFPHKTVFENIAFPLELKGVPRREREERVGEMLDLVRLPGIEPRNPAKLSGGEAQRVALARALVGRPAVLLLDEPLASLDLKLRKAMQLELRRIQEELGTTFVYVTHDQEEALTMSDWVVLVNHGRIVQQGMPAEIYEEPSTVFASSFIGEANLVDGTVVETSSFATIVRAGELEFVAPPSPFVGGDSVVLAVRPERLRVAMPGTHESANRFDGTIRRRVFLGNLVRLHVELSPDLVLTAEGKSGEISFQEGDMVELSWEPQASTLLPAA